MGNHICCAEELVGCGALSERRDAHGQPVLQKAAERCGERMVEILVEVRMPWGFGTWSDGLDGLDGMMPLDLG